VSPRRPAKTYQRGPHLYRRGAWWYARGGLLGREGVSLRTQDAAEAARRLGDLVARGPRPVGRAAPGAPATPAELTLVEAVARWLEAPHGYTARTLQSARLRLAAWLEWLAARRVTHASQVTPELLDAWVAERSRVVSRRTINRDLRAARVAVRWAVERGLVGACPAVVERAELREPVRHRRREVPDPDELARVLGAVESARYRASLETLAATGLRIAELRRLRPEHLSVDDVLRVEPEAGPAATAAPTKGYRERVVPLAPEAAAAVRRHLALALTGGRRTPPTERCLSAALHAACDAVGVPRCGLHDLRRAFATEAFRAGVPLTVLAGWLGHSDVRTTEGYVVAYRRDGLQRAPVPRALAGADSAQSPGAPAGSRGPTARRLRLVGGG